MMVRFSYYDMTDYLITDDDITASFYAATENGGEILIATVF